MGFNRVLGRVPGCLLVTLVGCADPRFDRDDGGSLDAGADRSGDEAGTAGDPVRDRWLGRYAVRTALFAVDGILQNAAQMLSLVEIKRGGDGLVLEEQLCKFEGGWNDLLVEGQLRFLFPDTKQQAPLSYDADTFSSAVNVFTYGYGPLPPGCATASSLALGPVPPWRSGDCLCVQDPGPPSDLRDCRINDVDGDGQAGFSFQFAVSGIPWVYQAVQEERIRYLNGYRQGDRLFAGQEFDLNTSILGCSGPPGDCQPSDGTSCPAKYNRSEFAPIMGDFTCARAIEREPDLFPGPVVAFPAGCRADIQ